MAEIFTNPNTTPDQIRSLVRSLPGILAGRLPDVAGIAAGFRSRIGESFLSNVTGAFDDKGRGKAGSDGITWKPLSRSYLAYQRPKTGRGPPKGGGGGPFPKDGLLTKAQSDEWWRLYRSALSWLVKRNDLGTAKGFAAGIAWKEIKKKGGRTKLDDPGFGGRKVGQYQIGRDRGILRNSLAVGVLSEKGVAADYTPPTTDQAFESVPGKLVVGTNVPYAAAFHELRPLWPETLPDSWVADMIDVAASGLRQIGAMIGAGGIR